MPKLNKSLINDLKADIGRGLSDSELRKKHGISEPTWCRWKHRGVIDRQKGLTTIHVMLLDILWEERDKVLDESLINKLEADIRRGLTDSELREKHDISKRTWYEWKYTGVIDRSKELKTLPTRLLDRLQEGREVVKQIENIVAEMALREGVSVSITTYKDKSGEIIETETTTVDIPDSLALKAALFWLIHRDSENWSRAHVEHAKSWLLELLPRIRRQ